MMYSEFCRLLEEDFECEHNQLPDVNEYEKIEFVYTWYPVELSKSDYCRIWMTAHPMHIINDMIPRAQVNKELNDDLNALIKKQSDMMEQIHMIKDEQFDVAHQMNQLKNSNWREKE